MRLGGARGPPGTEGATGGTVGGRETDSAFGGLLVSRFLVGDIGVLGPCSLFRLALRPSPKKKPAVDFEDVNNERVEDAEDTSAVDALERPLRGVTAKAGYGSRGGAFGGLPSPAIRELRSVAEYASGRLGKVTPESVDDCDT